MANESKFLKFQDIDHDGLIDICDDDLETPEGPKCLPCFPNPKAIIPSWKERENQVPYLNTKLCHYQVAIVTKYKTVVPQEVMALEDSDPDAVERAIEERFETYRQEAVLTILDEYGKDDSADSINTVIDNLIYSKYDLPLRRNSRLKLLYSVPHDIIYNLPERQQALDEEDEDESPGYIEVEYNAAQMTYKMIRVRKALWLYGQYLKMYRALDEGNIFFIGDNPPPDPALYEQAGIVYPPGESGNGSGRIFNLENYGDPAIFTTSTMSLLMEQLDAFLNTRRYNIPGVGNEFNWGHMDTVTKILFGFDDYKLTKMHIWTNECGPEKPIKFNKKRLKALTSKSAWKDKTAVAYFSQLWPMEASLTARVPLPWVDFVETFTWPRVKATFSDEDTKNKETPLSCMAEALENELKELGEDLLDDVFGIGDAIAYKFNKNICRFNMDEVRSDDVQMGLVMDPQSNEKGNIFAMAQMEAYKKLNQDDQIYVRLCARALANATGLENAQKAMDKMYSEGFERIKECGFFDMMLEVIQCLLGGLTLEEGLNSIIKAALENMSIENFGELFVGLPQSKQDELEAMVIAKMESGELVTLGTPNRPWEKPEVIADERTDGTEGPGDGMTPGGEASSYGQGAGMGQSETQRTLGTEYDVGAAQTDAAPDTMFSLYVGALLELYGSNLLELIDELNRFPGSQLIAHLIIAMDCPRPPLFNPSFMSWIKSIQLPFCRNITDMRAPRLENPFKWIPKLRDILKNLWEAIKWAVQQAIMSMLIKIFVKLCEILGNAICKALEVAGDIITSIPAMATGRSQIENIIRESICGPTATPEQVDDTIMDMMSSMGVGGAAFSNPETTMQFVEDISSSATRKELGEAFLGRPPREFLQVVDQLIEFEYPQFRDSLPNEQAVGRLMKNMGNLMPLDFRNGLEDMMNELPPGDAHPANPTLCATPEQLDNFKELRCQLLEGRATKEQCDTMFDELRNGFVQDLGDISNLMQGGLANYMKPGGAGGMPPLVSTEPGCDDGLFPYESAPQIAAHGAASAMAMESLRIAYSKDMMGNGGFLTGDKSWGLMNMALSDTAGNPLTAHWRKAKNKKSYVNFATNVNNGGEPSSGFFSFFQPNAGFSEQEGQFPVYVGEWLMRQFQNAGNTSRNSYQHNPEAPSDGGVDLAGNARDKSGSGNDSFIFKSHNKYIRDREINISYSTQADLEKLGWGMFWGQGVDLLTLPDFGYNSTMSVDFVNENIVVTKRARKGDRSLMGGQSSHVGMGGDINLLYHDNAAGMRDGCGLGTNIGLVDGVNEKNGGHLGGSMWSYGFNIQVYFSDLAEIQEPQFRKKEAGEDIEGKLVDKDGMIFTGYRDTGVIANRPDDNCRMKITELINTTAVVESPLAENATEDNVKRELIDLPNWIEHIPVVGWALQGILNLITMPFSQLFNPSTISGRSGRYPTAISVLKNRKFEFLSVDDGLDGFEMSDLGPPASKKTTKVLKWENYPETYKCFKGQRDHIPQAYMLAELIQKGGGSATGASIKDTFDEKMQTFYEKFAGEIGKNEQGWKYGAKYDTLQKSDLDYVIGPGYGDVGRGYSADTLYEEAKVVREETEWDDEGNATEWEWRAPENDDMILGKTRMELSAGKHSRVMTLNPGQFGGSYVHPPLHIKPLTYDGWMGLVQVWFPEMSPCKPSLTELVDFGEIQEKVQLRYPKIPEDPRLKQDEDCAFELPYNRILSRTAKAGLQGVIESSIRIYASTHFMKAIPTFSLVTPKFPTNYSSIFSAYVVEQMEHGFKDAQAAFWELFTTFKDEEFWYSFLEMSVQYYGWLLDAEEISDPPPSVIRALHRLNNGQETYDFPWFEDLWTAKETGDAGTLETLSSYRLNKNLEFVRATEEDAKLVLKELVSRELEAMGEKLNTNLHKAGFQTKIWDLDWWILMNMTNGGESLHVYSPNVKEMKIGLPDQDDPSWPGPYYTPGYTLRVGAVEDPKSEAEIGDNYVGYYHGYVDKAGDVIYVEGEYHSDAPQNLLVALGEDIWMGTVPPHSTARNLTSDEYEDDPEDLSDEEAEAQSDVEAPPPPTYESVIQVLDADGNPITYTNRDGDTVEVGPGDPVPFGDIAEYGSASSDTSGDKMFAIEKYVSINGQKMAYSQAKSIIDSHPAGALLSEVYPGTMKPVMSTPLDPGTAPEMIGVEGELGVRFGLQFYYLHGGKIPITSVEVDALDLPISQFQPFEGNSKLLWCLIYLLKEDPLYKLMLRYVFPLPKILSSLAIYNDMGFLSAIGEVTVGRGDYSRRVPMSTQKPPSSVNVGAFLDAIKRDGKKKKEFIPWDHIDNKYAVDGVSPGSEAQNKGYKKGEGRSWAARQKPGRVARIIYGFKTKTYPPDESSEANPALGDWLFGSDDDIVVNIQWVKDYQLTGNEGWQHYDDRQPGWFVVDSWGVKEWDSWDRKLLRNSNSRIKKMFKSYYYSRDFQPGDMDVESPGAIFIKNLKGALMPVPGGGILPWWRRGLLRSTPYNADGEMCTKSD